MGTVLIDCRECGGGRCKSCKGTGIKTVNTTMTTGIIIPNDDIGFMSVREQCECYQGICIHDGVVQCTHTNNYSGWCEIASCPACEMTK